MVPKEKNSASTAISSQSVRRGKFDHGADQVLDLDPVLGDDLSTDGHGVLLE